MREEVLRVSRFIETGGSVILKRHLLTWIFFAVFCGLFFASNISAQERLVFEDRFEWGLQPGWRWLRENPQCRRFLGNALEIAAEPYSDTEAKNVLVRPADFRGKGRFGVETKLTWVDPPTNQYQQGGIFWTQNGKVVFKLVCECVDGGVYIFPGKFPLQSDSVSLRIISDGDQITAEFRDGNNGEYRRVYEGRLDRTGNDEIGLQCWNGTPESSSRVLFHHFRIEQLGN